MSSMQSKRRRPPGVEQPEQPPREVTDRLAGLLPEAALDEPCRVWEPRS